MKYERLFPNERILIDKYSFVATHKTNDAGLCAVTHWHDYYELEIVTNGIFEHAYNNISCSVTRGDAFLITPLDFHSLRYLSDVNIINIKFVPEILPDSLKNYFSTITHFCNCCFEEDELEYIISRYDRLSSLDPELPFYKEQTRSIVCEIITIFLSKVIPQTDYCASTLFQETISYILNNFRKNLSVKSIAKKMSVSPNYLGAIFKKHVNTNLVDYLNTVRLKYACNMLVNTNISIKEVAADSGYNSQEHFMYIFKKRFGCTPTQYRNNNRSNSR